MTYRDASRILGPIGSFAKHPELGSILSKVGRACGPSLAKHVSSGRAYAYTPAMHAAHPEASGKMSSDAQFRVSTNSFEQLDFLFREAEPDEGEHVQLLGVIKNRRYYRWIRRDYLAGPDSFDRYKIAVPAANGSGSTTDFFGVPLNNPTVLGPGVGATQTFLTIGSFETEQEAQACLKYVSTKFARAMLGVLKATQHNPASKHVPLQDFTTSSDIDWTKPIPEIDQQLYTKYGLDENEIAFIETQVKPRPRRELPRSARRLGGLQDGWPPGRRTQLVCRTRPRREVDGRATGRSTRRRRPGDPQRLHRLPD